MTFPMVLADAPGFYIIVGRNSFRCCCDFAILDAIHDVKLQNAHILGLSHFSFV